MLKEVKGQTDYLKQLFLTSFKQYRLISSIFIVVLTLMVLGLAWIGYQQTRLFDAQNDLYAQVDLLSKQRLDGEMRLSEQIDHRLISLEQIMSDDLQASEQENKDNYPSYSLYTDEGDVGQIIGMEQQGRWITAKSAHGYLFAISPQGKVSGQGLEQYYLESNCAGLAYVNAMPGMVLRVNQSRLGYTELNGHNLMQQPSSWSRGSNECQKYSEQEALVLRPLLDNEVTITGVEDTLYFKGD